MRGHIQKRTLKNGSTRYSIVYDLPHGGGNRRQKSETVAPPHTRKHAEQVLAQRLAELHRSEFVEPSRMPFQRFASRWVSKYATGQVREGTLADYLSLFENHLFPHFGDMPLAEIAVEDVQEFKSTKLASGLSPQTVKHSLRLFRQMLGHAVEWELLRSNPADKVKNPRIPKAEMDVLSPAETQTLIQATPQKWRPLLYTAISTGLRVGELLAMKWKNLEWHSQRYFVRETLSRKRGEYQGGFTPPKTEGSARSVDLTPFCLGLLKQHQKRQAEEKLSAGPTYDDSGLVFATALGRPLDHNNIVHRQFHSALEKAGLRRIRFHDLRHTCASLLINEGVSPKYIQRQLRHESIQTTFDRYGHLFPETNEEAARVLDDALLGRGVPSNGHLTEQVETV
jgi:integrase